jgi:hypothetical protein
MSLKTKAPPERVSALLVLEGGKDVENLFVRKVGGAKCEVLSIPFWAYNISYGDTVECHPDEDGEGLFIEKVLEKSGNRTVRIMFKGPNHAKHPAADDLKDYFKKHQLHFEYKSPLLFAVNVPSEAEYLELVKTLERVPPSAEMIWEDGDPQPKRNIDATSRT